MTKILNKSDLRFLIPLLVFASIFLFMGTGNVQLVDWDENIYAEASKQMLLRGDYLNTFINNQPFAEKPPFFFWEQVLSYKVFGINEFAARFPSGLAGLGMILLCFFFGKWMTGSRIFGSIWSMVYLTSFLPSVFGRVGVIDHTFNLFISCGTIFLYIADKKYEQYQNEINNQNRPSAKSHWFFLTLASVFMGIAVLTKGPLGGVIPLVGFTSYKFFFRNPKVHVVHFLFCGFLSLLIASSWYIANIIIYGQSFLSGFVEFQLALFSKTLEGHTGPFYYHFIVAFFGMIPWTAFLFAYRPKHACADNSHLKAFSIIGFSWSIFILILMSFVSTKLPHYSASVYIPLSFFAAITIFRYLENKEEFPKWVLSFFLLFNSFLGIILLSLPTLTKQYFETQAIDFQVQWPTSIFPLGILYVLCILFSGFLLFRKKILMSLVVTVLAMFIFTQNTWRNYLPAFLSFHQKPLLDMMDGVRSKEGKIVFYRFVSFAALYYGNQPIDMLYTTKFESKPEMLRNRKGEEIYVFTADNNNAQKLKTEFPEAKFLEKRGLFTLFLLPKSQNYNN